MSNLNPTTKWKKGQSGNPAGRPKKLFDAKEEYRIQLTAIDPNDPQKRTNGQVAIAKQVELWKQGSIRAGNEILDRLLGKPPQALAIADMRNESRDELIAGILESLQMMKEAKQSADEEPTVH